MGRSSKREFLRSSESDLFGLLLFFFLFICVMGFASVGIDLLTTNFSQTRYPVVIQFNKFLGVI